MGKKIILTFDSFKGSLTSLEAGTAAARGAKLAFPDADCIIFEMADGGEGTCTALTRILGGKQIYAMVSDPLGNPIRASYGICGETAIIETAAASGLTLLPIEKRNPALTSSRGTGQLIADAINRGCRKFIIGLGGSAVNDAGTGLLRALGFRFLDSAGVEVPDYGKNVGEISAIDTSEIIHQLSECSFTCVCDVDAPLCGPKGASMIFAPQKGADQSTVIILDKALKNFGAIATKTIGLDLTNVPGVGCAGGIGFAMAAFLNAKLKSGIETIIEVSDLDNIIKGAEIVITGEGRIDHQTCMGKVPMGVLRHARKSGVPVIAVGGSVEQEAIGKLNVKGFTGVYSILPGPCEMTDCMKREVAAANLERTVSQLLRLYFAHS
ncbi:MAG: glycerate kinase [Muribaculaceae bacterium]|nr:glycerate kinase [Muribaculaceae bacterium]